MGPWVSYRPGTWFIDECQIVFFHELSHIKKSGPTILVGYHGYQFYAALLLTHHNRGLKPILLYLP